MDQRDDDFWNDGVDPADGVELIQDEHDGPESDWHFEVPYPTSPAEWFAQLLEDSPADTRPLDEARQALLNAGVGEGRLYGLLWELAPAGPSYPEDVPRLIEAAHRLEEAASALERVPWIYEVASLNEPSTFEGWSIKARELRVVASDFRNFAESGPSRRERAAAEKELVRLVDRTVSRKRQGRSLGKQAAHAALALLMSAASGSSVTEDKVRVIASRERQRRGLAAIPRRAASRSQKGRPAGWTGRTQREDDPEQDTGP